MSSKGFPSFPEFFGAITGNEPYVWQAELADLVEYGEWPGRIEIPTGLGKTATIAIAVYELARQLHHGGTAGRTAPQRIFHVVNRRRLVEGASRFIRHLAERINEGADHPDIAPVRNALKKLLGPGDDTPILFSEIHGQSNTNRGWLRATGCVIVTLTPHQFVSRLLMRGFGVSAGRRPVEAGLLGIDRLVLFDEPHLAAPAVQTIVDAERLQAQAVESLGIPGGSTVLLGATLPKELANITGRDTVLGLHNVEPQRTPVGSADTAHERLFAPRRLHLRQTKSASEAATAKEMVRLALAAKSDGASSVVVFANTVALAQRIYRDIQSACGEARELGESGGGLGGAPVRLITSRFRPVDRRVIDGDALSGITVATQTLEVGVDISFDALVTEAAPWNTLVQRLGRLNRKGRPGDYNAYVVAPASGKLRRGTIAVYDEDSVSAALELLRMEGAEESADGVDVSPGSLAELRDKYGSELPNLDEPLPRAATLHSGLIPLMTQTRPTPTPDLPVEAFILGPDLLPDPEVAVAWRANVSSLDEAEFGDVLASEEVSIPRRALARLLRQQASGDDGSPISDLDTSSVKEEKREAGSGQGRAKDIRVWDPHSERWRAARSVSDALRAERLVLPSDYGGYSAELGWTGMEGWVDDVHLVVVPSALEKAVSARGHGRIHVELSLPALESVRQWVGESDPLQDLWDVMSELEGAHLSLLEEVADSVMGRIPELLGALLEAELPQDMAVSVEIDGPPADLESEGSYLGRTVGCTVSAVAKRTGRHGRKLDNESRLVAHLEQVGEWASTDAVACGVEPTLAAAVGVAGRWHDVGKALGPFQRLLAIQTDGPEAKDPALLLAKSRDAVQGETRSRRAPDRRARNAAGVVAGYRHEAESVARFRAAFGGENGTDAGLDLDPIVLLTEHLIGSHHGWYRPLLPPVQGAQLQGFVHAADFAELHARYGPWGIAYLEALLRLADWRASAQPSIEFVEKVSGLDPFADFEPSAWRRPLAAAPRLLPEPSGREAYALTGIVEQLTGWFASVGLLAAAVDSGDSEARLFWRSDVGEVPAVPVLCTRLPLHEVVSFALDASRWRVIEEQVTFAIGGPDREVLRRKNQKLRPARDARRLLGDASLLVENPIHPVRGLFGDAMPADGSGQLQLPIAPFANNSSYPSVALKFMERADAVEECTASLFDKNRGFESTACDGGMDRSRQAQPANNGLGGAGDLRQVRTALAPLAIYGMGRIGNTGSQALGVRGEGKGMRLRLPIATLPVSFEELRARLLAGGGSASWHWQAIGGDWEYAAIRDSLTGRHDDNIWSGKIAKRRDMRRLYTVSE